MIASPRRTKIVCTLGPATDNEGAIRGLLEAGADVLRLNFSHGDRDQHRDTIRRIRRVSAALGREVAILQDLRGPKIRLGEVPGGHRQLQPGERIELAPEPDVPAGALPVSYPHLLDDVTEGERILVADGLVELEVRSRRSDRLVCEVVVAGEVSSHKGVNLPGSTLRVPSFTDKDRADLTLGLEEGVDVVALSFVRHEEDLAPVREMSTGLAIPPLVVAKIEKPQAVDRLCQILAAVDGIMVARGDLGVEMPTEEVPLIQKRIISEARRAAKPVITATQMLRSMVDSPRPTRAEAADVANAILDGTDAVMLSEETAVGRWPVESVAMLDRIARRVETEIDPTAALREPAADSLPTEAAAISRAAGLLALDLAAAAIVATTTSGSTARLVSRLRPTTPILALATSAEVERQLVLSWGVIPSKIDAFDDIESAFDVAQRRCVEVGLARPGDRIVATAGLPLHRAGTTNVIRVLEAPVPAEHDTSQP
jgi:pyruvate kinase